MHTSSQPAPPAPWSATSGKFFGLAITLLIVYLVVGVYDFAFFYAANRRLCDRQPAQQTCVGFSSSQSDAPVFVATKVPAAPAAAVEIDLPTPMPAISGATRVVISYRLNLRPQPGADDANQPIATLKEGDRVRLLGEQQTIDGGIWVLIEADGIQGWVNSRFLEEAP
jgi:hypothetical protein